MLIIIIIFVITLLISCGGIPEYSDGNIYTLTIETKNNGKVTPFIGKKNFWSNSIIDLTAIPNEKWEFKSWIGDVEDIFSNETKITIDEDKKITAVFSLKEMIIQENITDMKGEVVFKDDNKEILLTVYNIDNLPINNIHVNLIDDGDEKFIFLFDKNGEYYPKIIYLNDIEFISSNFNFNVFMNNINNISKDMNNNLFLNRNILNYLKENYFFFVEELICENIHNVIETTYKDKEVILHKIVKININNFNNYVWTINSINFQEQSEYENWYFNNITNNGFKNKNQVSLYDFRNLNNLNNHFLFFSNENMENNLNSLYKVSGNIKDSENKEGLENVELLIFGEDMGKISTFSNELGQWSKKGILGNITVQPQHEDYNFYPEIINLNREADSINFIGEEIKKYKILIEVNPINSGIVTDIINEDFIENSFITIQATPNYGFDFINWTYNDKILSKNKIFSLTMPSTNVTLNANFRLKEYQIIFNSNDENNNQLSRIIKHGEIIGSLPSITRYGYYLHEWNSDPNGEGIKYTRNSKIYDDIDLFAIWRIIPPPQKYYLDLKLNDSKSGYVYGKGYYLFGEKVNISAIPNEGYDFINWTNNNYILSNNAEFNFSMPNNNLIINANFTKKEYDVIFKDWNGDIIEIQRVIYGQKATLPTEPVRDGHKFLFWDKDHSNIKENTIINAIYEINKYELVLNGNNIISIPNLIEFEYLTKINIAVNPQENKKVTLFTVNNNDKLQELLEEPEFIYEFDITENTMIEVLYEDIYNSFLAEIDINNDLKDIEVKYGTTKIEAINMLANSIVIKDSKEATYTVEINWEIDDYVSETSGLYIAEGYFLLPEGIGMNNPEINSQLYLNVFVLEEVLYKLNILSNIENSGIVYGIGEYPENHLIEIKAIPNFGYGFISWNLYGEFLSLDSEYIYTMPSTDITIISYFEVKAGEIKSIGVSDINFNMRLAPALFFPFSLDDEINNSIANSFWISETVVNYKLWYIVKQWGNENDYVFANKGKEGSHGIIGEIPTENKNYPVVGMNWKDIIIWINAFNEMVGLDPVYYYDNKILKNSTLNNDIFNDIVVIDNNNFRLPYELEWELAARYIGKNKPLQETLKNQAIEINGYWWTPGNYASGAYFDFENTENNDNVNVAWYDSNSDNEIKEVALLRKNQLGLYDMSGNVHEYCFDIYNNNNTRRVIRGGAYDSNDRFIRLARRNYSTVNGIFSNRGFRLVKTFK